MGWGVGYFAVGLVAHDDEVLVVPARPELSLWVEQQEPRVVPPTPRQIQAPDEPYLWFSSARASFRGQHEKKKEPQPTNPSISTDFWWWLHVMGVNYISMNR